MSESPDGSNDALISSVTFDVAPSAVVDVGIPPGGGAGSRPAILDL